MDARWTSKKIAIGELCIVWFRREIQTIAKSDRPNFFPINLPFSVLDDVDVGHGRLNSCGSELALIIGDSDLQATLY